MLQIGQQIRVTARFVASADDTGPLADPTTIRLKVCDPNGAQQTFTYGVGTRIVRDAVGVYHADFVLTSATKPGKPWVFRWVGSGAINSATEIGLEVENSAFDKPL